MNNKIIILFFILATSVFGGAVNKPKQDKNKDKSTKISETKEKDKEKMVAVTKVDTFKTKLKTGLEIDSLDISNLKLKFLITTTSLMADGLQVASDLTTTDTPQHIKNCPLAPW